MLSLDESSFDQDLSNGGGGWRKIGNVPGCELAAAKLISAYREKHPSSASILAWHEGQMLASAGQYSSAVPLLESSKKEPSRDKAGWHLFEQERSWL
jgi:predicted Zn-dependent protease